MAKHNGAAKLCDVHFLEIVVDWSVFPSLCHLFDSYVGLQFLLVSTMYKTT